MTTDNIEKEIVYLEYNNETKTFDDPVFSMSGNGNPENTIIMRAGTFVLDLSPTGIKINGVQKDIDKDWFNTYKELREVFDAYSRLYKHDTGMQS